MDGDYHFLSSWWSQKLAYCQVFSFDENGDYFIKLINSYNSDPISTKLYKYGRELKSFNVSKNSW